MTTILDFDALRENKKEKGITIKGKTYYLAPVTYKQIIQLEEYDIVISEAIKKDSILDISTAYLDMIKYLIPELPKELLEEEFDQTDIRMLIELITQIVWGTADVKDEEVTYYREKYKDEFRKNAQRTRTKREE